MINYGIYIKASPLGADVFKIGIFALKHASSRLGTYQNAFGPTYEDRFEKVWVGPEQDVRELERLLKIKFRKKIAGTTRGYTEWVKDITFEELASTINEVIDGLGVAVIPAEGFDKVFEADIPSLTKKYLSEDTNH